jgi:DNA invertase Pin-like site-specific DNA recombinase
VIVGYARVSTDAQDYKGQETALLAAGAEKVFAEKVSGAVTDRKDLGRALAVLGAGDVLLDVLDAIAKLVRGSGRSRTRGRIPPRHTAS